MRSKTSKIILCVFILLGGIAGAVTGKLTAQRANTPPTLLLSSFDGFSIGREIQLHGIGQTVTDTLCVDVHAWIISVPLGMSVTPQITGLQPGECAQYQRNTERFTLLANDTIYYLR